MTLHPRQPELPAEIEEVWLAALEDAGIPGTEALLYALEGKVSAGGYHGWYMWRDRIIYPNNALPELDPLLDEINHEDAIDTHRVAIWTERTIEGTAAGIRHELEHGHQLMAHGEPLFELNALADRVIRERVAGLPGGAIFYQLLPQELDANAASAMFVRARYGDERIKELLEAGDPDASSFRSNVGPAPLDTLPRRVLNFLALFPDLCQLYAERQETSFDTLLEHEWPGSQNVYERLLQDPELQPPPIEQ